MNYIEFKKKMGQPIVGVNPELFFNVQKFVIDQNVRAFYPKNFFHENKETELYIFTEKDLWCFVVGKETTDATLIKDFQVDKLRIIRANNQRLTGSNLEIKLISGDEIFFNAKEDSNEDWVEQYTWYIEEIFDLLK
ncbi:DUF3908 family protein [Paenibacillus lautus]